MRGLRLVSIDADLWRTAFRQLGAEHAGGVEAPSQLAIGGEANNAPIAVNLGELFLYDLVGGCLHGHALVLHESADGAGYSEPDKVFADSGGRDSTGLIRCIGSRPNDRGVADSVPALGRGTSGGGSSGDVALAIQRYDGSPGNGVLFTIAR